MSLPKLVIKTEKVKLPVSGKTVELRPFTVKEQKAILLVLEKSREKNSSEKVRYTLSELSRLMQSCVTNDVLLEDLSIPDFMMSILHLRSLSVGETNELLYKCPCGSSVKFTFDINNIICTNKKRKYEKTIEISKGVSVVLDNLIIKDVLDIEGDTNEDVIIQTIAKCIKKVVDDETVYLSKDLEKEELIEFVESMPVNIIEKIKTFYDSLPSLKYKSSIDCPTGKVEMEVDDLEDFF